MKKADIDTIERAIEFLRDLQSVNEWKRNTTPKNNRYMADLDTLINDLLLMVTE